MATDKYTKRAIMKDSDYARYIDFLSFKLEDNKLYTLKQIDKIIKEFRERKVY